MLFNSQIFIFLFLPITLIGFYGLARRNIELALVWLVLASLFFYGWWNPVYLGLIGFSIVFNYSVGRVLGSWHGRAGSTGFWVLALGVAVNISLLAYFKYFNFFTENINSIFGSNFNFERIVLPLAISFFTFQQITFLVDAHSGKTKDYRFHHYALFVLFFPQLIAGPIVHHSEMMPQFLRHRRKQVWPQDIAVGISLFALGLFKKVIIADSVALYATPLFDAVSQGQEATFFEAWGGALAYTFQLYFDFSGYSDMAIGLAGMFGVRLPMNFNSPYKASSIIDFWRRWHMTLSRFLRDYVYIPLGGNRHGSFRRHVNLMITMLLGGLWHGAGWTFVIWGGLHGIYLVINHLWRALVGTSAHRRGFAATSLLATGLTFVCVVIAWVYFRAPDFATANHVLTGMAGVNGFLLPSDYQGYLGGIGDWLARIGWRFESGAGVFFGKEQVAWLGLCSLVVWLAPNAEELLSDHQPALGFESRRRSGFPLLWKPNVACAIGMATVFLVALLSLNRVSEFLYFQF